MKFYSDIIAQLGRFFGLVDATESEVHQALTEAKTYEELKADAISEAGLALEKMNEISAKMDGMVTEMEAVKTDNTEKNDKIEALDARVSELTAAVAAKDQTIADQAAEIKTLSESLATYKVKSTPEGAPKTAIPTEGGIPTNAPTKSRNTQVVSNEQFLSMFN